MDEYRKAKKNPYDLFEPDKPDYVGNPNGLIRRFQKGMGESMNTISRNLARPEREAEGGSNTPRLPGESIRDWKIRRGK